MNSNMGGGGKGTYKDGRRGDQPHNNKNTGARSFKPMSPNHKQTAMGRANGGTHKTNTSNHGSPNYHGSSTSIRDPNVPHDKRKYC